jgi:hypothetical protein
MVGLVGPKRRSIRNSNVQLDAVEKVELPSCNRAGKRGVAVAAFGPASQAVEAGLEVRWLVLAIQLPPRSRIMCSWARNA